MDHVVDTYLIESNAELPVSPRKRDQPSPPDPESLRGESGSFLSLFAFVQGRDRLLLVLALACSCLQGMVFPLFSVMLGSMSSSLVTARSHAELGPAISRNFWKMLGMAATILVLSFFANLLWRRLAANQTSKLKQLFFRVLVYQRAAWFDARKPEELAVELAEQIANFELVFSQKLNAYFFYFAQAIGGLAVGVYNAWLFSAVVILLAALLLVVLKLAVLKFQRLKRAVGETLGRQGALLEQALRQIKTVKSLGGEAHELGRLEAASARDAAATAPPGFVAGGFWGLYMLCVFAAVSALLFTGVQLLTAPVGGREFAASEIIAVLFCVLPGMVSLSHVGSIEWALEGGQRTVRTLGRLLRETEAEQSGARDPGELRGDIEFRGVSFAYPSNPRLPVLKKVSLSIRAGQKVALVGPSGSGKTTIAQLLERFYEPDEGQILLDGVDIREYDIHALRRRIGLVSQYPVLFTDSVAANIGLGAGREPTEEAMLSALEQVKGREFVENLPQGLQTRVANGGGSLSFGQRQKIAIARVLVRRPRIFIFDESTGVLDKSQEADVQRRLDQATKGATSIHIAHRISSVVNSDRIFVMKNGQVAEQGTHAELAQRSDGLYKSLLRHQASDLAVEDAPADRESSEGSKSGQPPQGISGDSEIQVVAETEALARSQVGKEPWSESLLRTLWSELADSRRSLVTGLACAVAGGAVNPSFGLFFANVLFCFGELDGRSRADPASEDVNFYRTLGTAYGYIIAISGLGFALLLLHPIKFGSFNRAAGLFLHRLKLRHFRKLLFTDIEFFDRKANQPARLTAELTQHTQDIFAALALSLPIIVEAFASFVAAMVIGAALCWRTAVFSFALTPALLAFKMWESRLGARSAHKGPEIDSVLLSEALGHMSLVRSTNCEEQLIGRFSAAEGAGRPRGLPEEWLGGLVFGLSQLFSYLVFGFILFGGTNVAVAYELDLRRTNGAVLSIIFGISSLLIINEYLADFLLADKGLREIRGKTAFVSKIELDPLDPENQPVLLRKKRPAVAGRIEFRAVAFRYFKRRRLVLKNLSFVLEPGKAVGLLGQSGAGKSAVLELLLRLYAPQSGEILLDGTNIEEFDLSYLRSLFGAIRQVDQLFDGTIAYNIAYNRPLTERELLDSAARANVTEFTSRDPEGFLKNVGSKGEKMSSGQKQRIILSRAFARKPQILLFDEPTAGLDGSNETRVLEALQALGAGRTRIVISSRARAVKDCDLVLVLENGEIAQSGSYDEVVKEGRVMH